MLGLLAALPAVAAAQIFAGVDAQGTTVLSNFRSDTTPHVVLAPAAPEGAPAASVPPPRAVAAARDPERLRTIIDAVAQETAVPARLLHAIIAVESAFDVRAVSHKGAQGLMQLMPATARRFGVVDPFDPRQNVAGGAAYLKWLLQRFDGNLALALAAYNAGEAAVVRAGYRIPPFEETRAYVPRVLARLRPGATY